MYFFTKARSFMVQFIACFVALLFVLEPVMPLWASQVTISQIKSSNMNNEEQKNSDPGATNINVANSNNTIQSNSSNINSNPDVNSYPPLVIGPGDILTISVLGFDRSIGGGGTSGSGGSSSGSSSGLPDTYLVDSDGNIFFPFIGVVNLKGLTQIEASYLLMKKLKGYLTFPQVLVVITTSNTYIVSVMGDVNRPGQFMIRGKPDILSMLTQAGGPGPNPDLGGTELTRGTQKFKIDLGKLIYDKNYRNLPPTVYPGDIIYVPQNFWPSLADVTIVLGIIISGFAIADIVSKK